jgi:hypothetical protein
MAHRKIGEACFCLICIYLHNLWGCFVIPIASLITWGWQLWMLAMTYILSSLFAAESSAIADY